jgi:hypothetical protein
MLSALQQQQIMMLECMIAAYTFSALTLEGARSSERQMMASGCVARLRGVCSRVARVQICCCTLVWGTMWCLLRQGRWSRQWRLVEEEALLA